MLHDHPLSYWLGYVRHLGGTGSPVIIVQTRCDRPEDEARRLPVEDADIDGFPFVKFVQYSSLKNRGRAALDEALCEAAAWLNEQQGTVQIGAGRLRVRRRLEALREADANAPPAERQYRTLSQEFFRELCAEAGGISSPEYLLDYLHHTGVVFYREGLFGGHIVLDQAWALEAIYTVFHRELCYRELKRLGGRFTRSLLELLVWREYSPDEQQLFLDMMQTCGVCFVYRKADDKAGIEAEYIAPDLLPERAEVEEALAEKWDDAVAKDTLEYHYALHQPGLLRSLMAEIGQQAGVNGLYWRGGVCVYEHQTRSHALIEQETTEGWRGLIRISTQGGQAQELLAKLRDLLKLQNSHWGLQAIVEPRADKPHGRDESTPLAFAASPKPPGREYFVSYAWGDKTQEGIERDAVVEHFCARAKEQGIAVIHDKDILKLGDRVTPFMQRIGRGHRVFIVISRKYLQSPYCMYELFEIWRNCRGESDEFLQRVRIYTTSCAKIFSVGDRVDHALYWKKQHEGLQAVIREHSADVLGAEDFKAYKRMDEFARHVGDILHTVADVIHARRFEDLETYAFE